MSKKSLVEELRASATKGSDILKKFSRWKEVTAWSNADIRQIIDDEEGEYVLFGDVEESLDGKIVLDPKVVERLLSEAAAKFPETEYFEKWRKKIEKLEPYEDWEGLLNLIDEEIYMRKEIFAGLDGESKGSSKSKTKLKPSFTDSGIDMSPILDAELSSAEKEATQ